MLQEQKRDAEAYGYALQGLKERIESGTPDEDMARLTMQVARSARLSGRMQESLPLVEEADRFYRRRQGKSHSDIVQSLSIHYITLGDKQKAEAALKEFSTMEKEHSSSLILENEMLDQQIKNLDGKVPQPKAKE
jgi:hypothetical protein